MKGKRSRSAESGKFVTGSEAAEHPATTVVETIHPRLTKEAIAKTAYNVNRAYCESLGDHSFGTWEEAPEWQRISCFLGVDFHLRNPGATAEASHQSWFAMKWSEGWQYGPKKDPEKKEHPCMVPFEDLPLDMQTKDHLFMAVVKTLIQYLPKGD